MDIFLLVLIHASTFSRPRHRKTTPSQPTRQPSTPPRSAANQTRGNQSNAGNPIRIIFFRVRFMTDLPLPPALSSALQNASSVAASSLGSTEGMASNSIKLLTGNSHPGLAQAVAKRYAATLFARPIYMQSSREPWKDGVS